MICVPAATGKIWRGMSSISPSARQMRIIVASYFVPAIASGR
jgi:hypothetical protein